METFFVRDNGVWRLPNVGEVCCRRPALARTLELVARDGVQKVYSSEWGDDLIDDIRSFPFPGILHKRDLVRSKPIEKEPIRAKIFGLDVLSVPLPSSSATLLMALKFLESYTDRSNMTLNYHRTVEAMKHMFAVRTHFGDPGKNNRFLNLDDMLGDIKSPSFISDLRRITTDSGVQDLSVYGGKYNRTDEVALDEGTSHICTVDSEGNAVSMTTSINWNFGSLMISEKTGLLLNNHMNDFTLVGVLNHPSAFNITSSANLIFPRRKPLSSMSPLIFTKNKKLKLVIGASGGPTILTSLLDVLHKHLGTQKSLEETIKSGRIHSLLSGPVIVQDAYKGSVEFTVPDEIQEALRHLGHQVVVGEVYANIVALEVLEDDVFRGLVDPRKDGAAASNLKDV